MQTIPLVADAAALQRAHGRPTSPPLIPPQQSARGYAARLSRTVPYGRPGVHGMETTMRLFAVMNRQITPTSAPATTDPFKWST